jgi:hypothetical protein
MSGLEDIADIAIELTGSALSSLAERDARADGNRREIHCSMHAISIKRQMQGIAMKIDISARAYRGVSLSIIPDRNERPVYRVCLQHADADLAIVLFEAIDDQDVAAVWKAWAQYFALPKLIERRPGEFEGDTRHIGATVMGAQPQWRRRGGLLAQRKPKLLNRRRAAHAILGAHASGGQSGHAQELSGSV